MNDKWQVGKRVLIRKNWSDYPKEVTILEISPSGKYVKVHYGFGEEWEIKEDYILVEVL